MAYEKPEFDLDLSELTPGEAHDAWESATDLDAAELRGLRDDPSHDAYLETAENNQGDDDPPIPGGPLDDAIHLATTPRDEWGPDERAEAEEALNWGDRHHLLHSARAASPNPGTDTVSSTVSISPPQFGHSMRPRIYYTC